MRFRLFPLFVVSITLLPATEPDAATARWWSHIKALGNDQMEGRDTGSPGYQNAERYVIREFERAGLKPAGTNGFRQPVPLNFIKLNTRASSLAIERGGKTSKLEWLNAATLTSLHADLPAKIHGKLYFAGDGSSIHPREISGKIVVLLSPPRFSSAPPAVKPEILVGAAAIFSIDTSGGPEPPRWPAAYASAYHLADEKETDHAAGPVHFRLNPELSDAFFAGSGHSLSELHGLRDSGKPLPNFELTGSLLAILKMQTGSLVSDNIIAVLPGSDPVLRHEYVALSAHLDGYGRGEPWHGDAIYNGAFDDAAYVATLIDLAQQMQESRTQLKRSLLLCIVTGEEKGLLGSKYFAAHPTVAKGQIAADLNLDQLRPIFPLRMLTVLALNDSSLGTDAKEVATSMGIGVQPDPEPERGLLRRSDHYSFMRIGVPALNFVFGYQKGTEDEAIYRSWYAERYHSPADDLSQPWVPEAAAKFNRFYRMLVEKVANASERPHWNAGSKFAASGQQ